MNILANSVYHGWVTSNKVQYFTSDDSLIIKFCRLTLRWKMQPVVLEKSRLDFQWNSSPFEIIFRLFRPKKIQCKEPIPECFCPHDVLQFEEKTDRNPDNCFGKNRGWLSRLIIFCPSDFRCEEPHTKYTSGVAFLLFDGDINAKNDDLRKYGWISQKINPVRNY